MFQKGQSGNPKGRPKVGKTLTEQLRKVLAEKTPDGVTKAEAIARKLVDLALEDSVPAIKELFDRLEGKPPQRLEHAGDLENPIRAITTVEIIKDYGKVDSAREE